MQRYSLWRAAIAGVLYCLFRAHDAHHCGTKLIMTAAEVWHLKTIIIINLLLLIQIPTNKSCNDTQDPHQTKLSRRLTSDDEPPPKGHGGNAAVHFQSRQVHRLCKNRKKKGCILDTGQYTENKKYEPFLFTFFIGQICEPPPTTVDSDPTDLLLLIQCRLLIWSVYVHIIP
jgi:hypothetical protein